MNTMPLGMDRYYWLVYPKGKNHLFLVSRYFAYSRCGIVMDTRQLASRPESTRCKRCERSELGRVVLDA